MAREITSGYMTQIEARQLRPILLVKGEFDSGTVTFWSGLGEIVFNSETYYGSGNLIQIQPIEETQDLAAYGTAFVLSGVPPTLLSLALTEEYQGRPASCFFGVLDDDMALISDPYQLFSGSMDQMSILDTGSDSKITIKAEGDLIALKENRERRYTAEDQKTEYSDDLGFDFVSSIQDIELTWGAGL